MKIGFVFECGPDGGDVKVLKHLLHMIYPKAEFLYEPLSAKPILLKQSGKAVNRLLVDGCEKVFIVWDLYPAWREDKGRPCRHEDKEAITNSLTAFKRKPTDIIFLCLEEELEAWLLADGRVLSEYFSKPHRKVKVENETRPDKVKDPKGKLIGYFKEYKGGSKYDGNTHAEQIVKMLYDFQKLKKSETFTRFHKKLTGKDPA